MAGGTSLVYIVVSGQSELPSETLSQKRKETESEGEREKRNVSRYQILTRAFKCVVLTLASKKIHAAQTLNQ